MPDAVPLDVSADDEANKRALLEALLSGKPLVVHDSERPDIPPVPIGIELERIDPEARS